MSKIILALILLTSTVAACDVPSGNSDEVKQSVTRGCVNFKPSRYLPSDQVAEISVTSSHRKKYWTWGYTDYTRSDEVAEGGYLHGYDTMKWWKRDNDICLVVERSTASRVDQIEIDPNVTRLLIKDGSRISLEGIEKYKKMRSIVLVNTPMDDDLPSSPPSSLIDIILIDSGVGARDIDYLPEM